MWYTIKEGKHRASPLSLGIHFGKIYECYEVEFTNSCRYDLIDEDQEDVNKLFGWSYGVLPTIQDAPNKIVPAHHQNSVRVGWRYDKGNDDIELLVYLYKDGIREVIESLSIPIGKKYFVSLSVKPKAISLCTWEDEQDVGRCHLLHKSMIPKWGYDLGLFFGGNESQPNKEDMKIWMKKLKKP